MIFDRLRQIPDNIAQYLSPVLACARFWKLEGESEVFANAYDKYTLSFLRDSVIPCVNHAPRYGISDLLKLSEESVECRSVLLRNQSLYVLKHEGFRLLLLNDSEIRPYEFTALALFARACSRNTIILTRRPACDNVRVWNERLNRFVRDVSADDVITDVMCVCFRSSLVEVIRELYIVACRLESDSHEAASAK